MTDNRTIQQSQKVRQQLEAALTGVASELAKVLVGEPSFSTKKELELIDAKLREMLESLSMGRKPEIPGLSRIVTDTWPHTRALSNQTAS